MALRVFQFLVRFIQFCCSAVILAIFAYFLAALIGHDLPIGLWVPAVAGISGAGLVYVIFSLLLLCCLPGHILPSILLMILDVVFIAGFSYIAVVNRGGASPCEGEVDTAFGRGDAESHLVDDDDRALAGVPSLGTACQMETASLAVSIIAAIFFVFSIILSGLLISRRRKEKRYGPSAANGYTSGSGAAGGKRFGLFGRKGTVGNPNALPAHTTPDDVRSSYATEQTRVGSSGYASLGEGAGKADPAFNAGMTDGIPTARYPNATNGYRYDNGGYDNNGGVFR